MELKELILKAEQLVQKETAYALKEADMQVERRQLDMEQTEFTELLCNLGLRSLELTDNRKLSIKETFHCSLNKNPEDVKGITDWLIDHDAEHLVNVELKVDGSFQSALEASGIPMEVESKMNTSRIKAWLIDQSGYNGGHHNIDLNEVPKGIHIYIEKKLELK